MSTSLSSLVDNFSEIYSKKCRDKNCQSKCDFIGLKNNKLYYKYKKCKKAIKNNKWVNQNLSKYIPIL